MTNKIDFSKLLREQKNYNNLYPIYLWRVQFVVSYFFVESNYYGNARDKYNDLESFKNNLEATLKVKIKQKLELTYDSLTSYSRLRSCFKNRDTKYIAQFIAGKKARKQDIIDIEEAEKFVMNSEYIECKNDK